MATHSCPRKELRRISMACVRKIHGNSPLKCNGGPRIVHRESKARAIQRFAGISIETTGAACACPTIEILCTPGYSMGQVLKCMWPLTNQRRLR